jgi:hypothetical protein
MPQVGRAADANIWPPGGSRARWGRDAKAYSDIDAAFALRGPFCGRAVTEEATCLI